jgi:hypothetical protein
LSERYFELIPSDADTSISTTIAVNNLKMYTPGTLSLYLGAAIPADLVPGGSVALTPCASKTCWVADLNLLLPPSPMDESEKYLVVVTGTNNVKSLGFGTSILTATVPEPSTWAMMLIGFAGLGYAGYRQRHKLAGPASV